MEPISIMLVDSEEIFLEGLAEVLQSRFQTDIVFRGRSVSEILENAGYDVAPDIVIMGKDTSGDDVNDCIKKTAELFPYSKIALVLSSDQEQDPVEIIKSGARACLSRTISGDDLAACIKLVLKGRIIISSAGGKYLHNLSTKGQDEGENPDVLSEREGEIAALVAQGKTNREISDLLFVSENTVKAHVRNILSKLHFKNRQQLVAYTVSNNLVSTEL